MQRGTVFSEFTHQAESFNRSVVANAAATLGDLIALARPQAPECWVEFACGPGIVSRHLAPSVRQVHGIDVTPAMIKLAQREAAAAGIENATFEVGDATATRLEPASADGAIARFAIHHLPVPGRLVEEMVRIVRPGGTVVLADHIADDNLQAFAWSQEIERLRDPSHWATLPANDLRSLGTENNLALEEERLLEIELDFSDWLARGSASDTDRKLVRRALSDPPTTADCFRVTTARGREVLQLRVWLSRWRR